jgi:CO/xanthine dehydrogenase FAD-binding subunit
MGVVEAPEVIVAASREEAVSAFGDGSDVTVVAGGTIVMPDITHGLLRPRRALLIGRAGLSGVRSEGGRTTIGATTSVADLQDAVEPLGTCARGLADIEVRAQATLGGNLCAPPGVESPRGDLQAALLVLDAQVRSTGAGGERTEPVEDSSTRSRRAAFVLDVVLAASDAGASASVRRPTPTPTRSCALPHASAACCVSPSRAPGPPPCAAARSRARSPTAPTTRPPPSACSTTSHPTTMPSRRAGTAHGRCLCSSAAPSTTCAEGER